MSSSLARAVALLTCCAVSWPAFAQDNVVGPWGQANGCLWGRAQANGLSIRPFLGGITHAWEFDTVAHGLNRPLYNSQMVFDAEGNLYWLSNGNVALASVSPAGTLRWSTPLPGPFGQPGQPPRPVATGTPVVGHAAVYAFRGGDTSTYDFDGDGLPGNVIGAYDKATGAVLWETEIDGPDFGQTQEGTPWPVLYNGKLYVLTRSQLYGLQVTQVDAATGAIDWRSVVDAQYLFAGAGGLNGQAVFVPDFFAVGEHALFVQFYDGDNDFDPSGGVSGLKDVTGIKVTAVGATRVWQSPGGNFSYPHLIYSPDTHLLYSTTWGDQQVVAGAGAASYAVYDALDGDVVYAGLTGAFGGLGAAALDFDQHTVLAGAAQGWTAGQVWIHRDGDGDGVPEAIEQYLLEPCSGAPSYMWQLFPGDAGGGPYLLTGGQGSTLDPNCTPQVAIYDLSQPLPPAGYHDPVAVYETAPSPGRLRGGPLLGPQHRIYHFHQDNQKLIALAPVPCPGDANCDGSVDFRDINAFVARLACPGGDPENCNIGCPWQAADVNADGAVTFKDIDPFVGCLGNLCP